MRRQSENSLPKVRPSSHYPDQSEARSPEPRQHRAELQRGRLDWPVATDVLPSQVSARPSRVVSHFNVSHSFISPGSGFGPNPNTKHGLKCRGPFLVLQGPYTINGRILVLPINGNGISNFTLGKPQSPSPNRQHIHEPLVSIRNRESWVNRLVHRQNEAEERQERSLHRRHENGHQHLRPESSFQQSLQRRQGARRQHESVSERQLERYLRRTEGEHRRVVLTHHAIDSEQLLGAPRLSRIVHSVECDRKLRLILNIIKWMEWNQNYVFHLSIVLIYSIACCAK